MRASGIVWSMVSAALAPLGAVGCSHHAATASDAGMRHDAGLVDAGRDSEVADATADASDDDAEPPPAVYTTSNQATGNAILVFPRARDGTLRPPTAYDTGGLGALGGGFLYDDSQGALVYDATQRIFLAVNTGDSTLTMMALESSGVLRLLTRVPSGGSGPVSVTIYHDLVYVLNDGASAYHGEGPSTINGFRITNVSLTPIAGSTQPLSTTGQTSAAQIQFTPDGTLLIVTERFTNLIDTYVVGPSGVAGPPNAQRSSGETPFGFSFSAGGQLIVSEAHRSGASVSSASSYSIADGGTLTPVSKAVPTHQTDDCWIVVVGPHAYGTNTRPSANISGFNVSPMGALSLLDDGGVTGVTGQGCEDEAVTADSQFLYTINAISRSISAFRIQPNGALTKLPDYMGIPSGVAGLVAR